MSLNRSIISLLTVIILISASTISTPAIDLSPTPQIASNNINFDKISFNGIKYNMSEANVLKKLGQPAETKTETFCYGQVQRLTYSNMVVDIQETQGKKTVVGIEVTGRNMGIDRVVKVGDSIAKAKRAYAGNIFMRNGDWFARPQYSEIFLNFKVNKAGKITKISIGVDC